jgi:PAS domain S-box-containing protein
MVLGFRNQNVHKRGWGSSEVSIEELLSDFSAKFTSCRPDQIESLIETGLLELLKLTGSGCVSWYEEDPNRQGLKLAVFSTDKPGSTLFPSILSRDVLPYTFEALSNGAPVVFRSLKEVPLQASQDRSFLSEISVWGLILTPSDCDTHLKGVLVVSYIPQDLKLTHRLLNQVTVLNNLIVTAVERRRMHARWRESEERFRWLFQNAPIGVGIENLAGDLLFVNPALCSMLGYAETELLGIRFLDLLAREINGEDDLMLQRLHDGLVAQYRTEKQFIRNNGTRFWGRVDVALFGNESEEGHPPLLIKMVEDITEQKHADDELLKARTELEQLAEHLIKAQEEERHRISRELHDDIAQKLSLLSIGFDSLGQCLADEGCDRELDSISELKAQIDILATDVHALSHRLHSTRLQHLGLRSAVEELTKQLSKQYQISISFTTYGRDAILPHEISLCLFRVTQEALNNVVRHSRAQSVFVELEVKRGIARLQISDTGVGFDVSCCEGGIGIVSMRERLRMVGGEVSVQSRLGEGTLITATVPFTEMTREKAA